MIDEKRLPFATNTFKLMARLILLFCVLVSSSVWALEGRVVKIVDGDTIHVLTDQNKSIKIRLENIDTPERKQPFGKKAKQALADLIFGKHVYVDEQLKPDRYKRVLGTVWLGSLNVNRELVVMGLAWVYPRYNQDDELPGLQDIAKRSGLGLWGLPEHQQIPPWQWRKTK